MLHISLVKPKIQIKTNGKKLRPDCWITAATLEIHLHDCCSKSLLLLSFDGSNRLIYEGKRSGGKHTNCVKINEKFVPNCQQRVLNLENTKTAQAQEISSLKWDESMRVKKLEKKGGSRTHKLRRLYKVGRSARVVSSDEASLGDQEDASKQGRKIHDIDADEDITLENVHDAEMFDVNDLHGDEVFVEKEVPVKEVSVVGKVNTASIATTVSAATITEDEITLAQALAELKSVKPKVTTATTATTKGILLQEPSESITTTTTTIPSKDKGKGIMVEEPLKMKKKDQISFDEQEAIRLQAEFDEEVRLAREKDEANVALIEEWNDIQAKIDADYQLAQRLQAQEQEELTTKERAKLFQQLLEKRRKHFAAKRNMAGRKSKDLKNKRFDSIQKLFDKAMKRVNTFVAMDIEMVEGSEVKAEAEIAQESSSKRAGEDLQQESTKKQKIDDVKETTEVDEDKETYELQSLMKVIPDEEEVAVDAIPLATKPPSIVEFKILKEGKISYFQIIRADRSSNRYSAFIHMLRSFDREDLKLLEKRYPLTPATITEMLNKKLQADHWNEMFQGRIVGIKRLLDDLRVTDAKLMLLVQKLLLLVLKVNTAGMKVTTAERLQLLEEFMLTEKRPKSFQRKYKDFLKIKIT
ncbi:hypothetical protein Tco_1428998 [Tanacetum coccineum]